MNWNNLYNNYRTGTEEKQTNEYFDSRNSFVRDYDRIIFSSAFRRLQNKTQVFPLPGAVFVHNRLTHSLEVASVGRSLATSVGEFLAAKPDSGNERMKEFYLYELSSVVAAACLAHDIGNPPFGHSGEDAIRSYFENLDGEIKKVIEDNLSVNQLNDFKKFEGNSNALRILTNSFNELEPGGYRLTYPTLAAMVKYPCSATEGFNKSAGLIATKKSGFFETEMPVFEKIAASMHIPKVQGYETVYSRHPFVYLTEAADDICYRVIDLEDAHRLHIIDTRKFLELFLPFFDGETGYFSRAYIESKLAKIVDENQAVQYVRARWIGLMIEKVAAAFKENEKALLEGNLEKDLLDCLPPEKKELIKVINKFSVENIYNNRSVVEIEIAGYNVIGGLLKEFVTAVVYPQKAKSRKLLQLVSRQFPVSLKKENIYFDVLSLLDFIAGMTDLYAIDLFRKITGMNIPEIR